MVPVQYMRDANDLYEPDTTSESMVSFFSPDETRER